MAIQKAALEVKSDEAGAVLPGPETLPEDIKIEIKRQFNEMIAGQASK